MVNVSYNLELADSLPSLDSSVGRAIDCRLQIRVVIYWSLVRFRLERSFCARGCGIDDCFDAGGGGAWGCSRAKNGGACRMGEAHDSVD